MKRGILILLFILISAFSVNAMTVELKSPSNGIIYQNRTETYVDVTCSATIEGGEVLENVTLFYYHNESEDFFTEGPQEPASGVDATFSINDPINATYTWNCLAVHNDSVETYEVWASENYTFVITFTTAAPPSPNTAPSCTVADTNITVDEDSGSWTLDSNMSGGVNISCTDDTDHDALTYTITSPSGGTGSYGTFTNPNNDDLVYTTSANQSGGTDIVTLSISDGTDSVTISAQVTVTAINDAPYLSDIIPNKTWDEDTTAKIDLDGYFADFEDSDSSLNYSYDFTSSSPININVTIESDGDAVFTPEDDWTGTETLTFTAYDTGNLSVTSNEVTLTVQETNETATNTPPSIDTIIPETDPTISVGVSQTFTITKSDADGDSMNVTWYVDNVPQEGEIGNSFTYTASAEGSFSIKVAVSDGEASDTNTWTLTVTSAQAKTNKTAPPGDEKVKEETSVSVCGDGTCDKAEDENCVSCPEDCGCPSGTTCNEERKTCVKEVKSRNIILLIVILALFGGGAGAGIYFYKKKQEEEIFGLASTPFKLPPKEEEGVKKEEVKQPKEPAVVKGPAKKPLKKAKTTNQVLLKKYIIYNLKKGKSFEQVKKELLKVGWTESQIQDAYTAAQLDEAFS